MCLRLYGHLADGKKFTKGVTYLYRDASHNSEHHTIDGRQYSKFSATHATHSLCGYTLVRFLSDLLLSIHDQLGQHDYDTNTYEGKLNAFESI